jgi:hypothetical protein
LAHQILYIFLERNFYFCHQKAISSRRKWRMKRIALYAGPALMVVLFLGFVAIAQGQPAFAAKPSRPDNDVIAKSNGYPSGPHFNLNIHGKKAGYTCDPTPGGNSVFILEYGSQPCNTAPTRSPA